MFYTQYKDSEETHRELNLAKTEINHLRSDIDYMRNIMRMQEETIIKAIYIFNKLDQMKQEGF